MDELVPENHMVRVVDSVIDRLDISDILSTYYVGGNSTFNSIMMLKILVFAYLSNVYSSRRIKELLKRDIYLAQAIFRLNTLATLYKILQ
ncbi:MAG: transposase [Barnesiella sp.]|nr:transposase [Barnesiella sp.]